MVDWLFLHQHAGMLVQYLNDTSDSLVIVLDDDARIVDANRSFRQMAGLESGREAGDLNNYLIETSRLTIEQLIEWTTGPQMLSFRNASGDIRIFSCWILPIPMGFLLIGENQSASDPQLLDRVSDQTRKISELTRKLDQARTELRTLKLLLPVCTNCNKVLNDDGKWVTLQQYLHERPDSDVGQDLCPDCEKASD